VKLLPLPDSADDSQKADNLLVTQQKYCYQSYRSSCLICIRLNGQLGQQLALVSWSMNKPPELVDQLPRAEPQLEALQRHLEKMVTQFLCFPRYFDFQ